MEALEQKSLAVPRGYSYNYYVTPLKAGANPDAPALLFVHGWPDDATLWQFVVPKLLDLPFRIIIPDLLGVGGSSKPKHVAAYNFSYITNDLVSILEHEDIKKVILIGHDWGAGIIGRFWLYAPEFVAGMILLNVAYTPPSDQLFDLDAINEMTRAVYGFGLFEYWHFFTSDEGSTLMSEKPDKVWQFCHLQGPQETLWCYPNKIREFMLDDDAVLDVKDYAKDVKLRQGFVDRVRKDGLATFQTYYKAWVENVQYESEKVFVPKHRHVVKVPTLYIGCTNDAVARPESINLPKDAGLLPDLKVITIESGHWCTYEKPEEVATAIRGFVSDKFAGYTCI